MTEKKKKSQEYLIETPHSAVQCKIALEQIGARGFATHFHWGCKNGVHSGWGFFEAESKEELEHILPAFLKRTAKITPVDVITMDVIESWKEG